MSDNSANTPHATDAMPAKPKRHPLLVFIFTLLFLFLNCLIADTLAKSDPVLQHLWLIGMLSVGAYSFARPLPKIGLFGGFSSGFIVVASAYLVLTVVGQSGGGAQRAVRGVIQRDGENTPAQAIKQDDEITFKDPTLTQKIFLVGITPHMSKYSVEKVELPTMTVDIIIQNDLDYAVKDFTLKCALLRENGTALDQVVEKLVPESIPENSARSIQAVNFGQVHLLAKSVSCEITSIHREIKSTN
jgi:hypothetical protein